MNRIVLEHYPVDKLPEDLRKHFSRGGSVTLEVKEEEERAMTTKEVVEMLRAARERNKDRLRTQKENVAEIRELRDEWDD